MLLSSLALLLVLKLTAFSSYLLPTLCSVFILVCASGVGVSYCAILACLSAVVSVRNVVYGSNASDLTLKKEAKVHS